MNEKVVPGFYLYKEYRENLELLSKEERGTVLTAVYQYVYDGVVSEDMNTCCRLVFNSMKYSIDSDMDKYERKCAQNSANGKKGGRPRKNSGDAAYSEGDSDEDISEKSDVESSELPSPKVSEVNETEDYSLDFSDINQKPNGFQSETEKANNNNNHNNNYNYNNNNNNNSNNKDKSNSKDSESEILRGKAPPVVPCGDERSLSDKFSRFWDSYPKKVGKEAALKVFKRLKVDDALLETMLSAIERHKRLPQWSEVTYIPNPSTWLSGRRWEDEDISLSKAEKRISVKPINNSEYDAYF